MAIEIIRCLQDNYAYLVHDEASGDTTLIDAPEAAPILQRLAQKGWTLTHIFITHHHHDHIGAVPDLRAAYQGVQVWGNGADAERLPPLDHAFAPSDTLPGGATVFDAPGHTIGHVAFHYPALTALFTADSLMTHGCGRLFEGTADQMYDSIARMAALPDETRIYAGHDYARANLAFAAPFNDPDAHSARVAELPGLAERGEATTGTTLASERRLNPYLRCALPQVAQAAGLPGADPRAVFAEIRRQKDNA